MLGFGQDMELLTAVGAMAVPNEAKVFENVERAIDRRRDRLRIGGSTALEQLGGCDMPLRVLQNAQQKASLRCPAQPTGMQSVARRRPRLTPTRANTPFTHADHGTTGNADLRSCNNMQ